MKMPAPRVLPRLVLVATLAACSAHAQQKSAAPTLASPPTKGSWTITYKDKTEKDKTEKKPKPLAASESMNVLESQTSAKVTKQVFSVDGERAKCVTHYSDGKTVSAIIFGSLGIIENPDDPGDLYVENYSVDYFSGGNFRNRFIGLEWVRPESYKGTVELDDVICHYFKETGNSAASLGGTRSVTAPQNAYINGGREAWLLGNGLPVQVKDRGILQKYTFRPPGEVAAIDVPPRFLEKARRYLASMNPKEEAYSGNR